MMVRLFREALLIAMWDQEEPQGAVGIELGMAIYAIRKGSVEYTRIYCGATHPVESSAFTLTVGMF